MRLDVDSVLPPTRQGAEESEDDGRRASIKYMQYNVVVQVAAATATKWKQQDVK
jgi:hypothetical protein